MVLAIYKNKKITTIYVILFYNFIFYYIYIMKQLVTFFILTIIFYYITLFLGRCISTEYKKLKVREFVEGFEELSKDKIEGFGVVRNRRKRQRAKEAARRKALDNQSKLITGIVAARQTAAEAKVIEALDNQSKLITGIVAATQTAAEAKVIEADATRIKALNEEKEIDRKRAQDENRAEFQKEFLADDEDDGSDDFFKDQSPDFFKKDVNEQPLAANEDELKMAFDYKQKQLEEQEEIARQSRKTMMLAMIGFGVLLIVGIVYFLFIRKKGKTHEVKTSSTPKVEAPKVEAPKVEAPVPKS